MGRKTRILCLLAAASVEVRMTELLHAELTKEIIGVYYDVYNGLSRTYPEYIYEAAMMLGLEKEKGIPCVQQDEYEI